MDKVYLVLHRTGPEWDGQRIYKTKSKALFDFIDNYDFDRNNVYFYEFSEELKQDVLEAIKIHNEKYPDNAAEFDGEPIEIWDAMEWLELPYSNKEELILAGDTELTCSWNW